ncbi:MAG TPA: hypothetical protein VEP50_10035 [bacterium]|nr:hypothetical protein [bacterium]
MTGVARRARKPVRSPGRGLVVLALLCLPSVMVGPASALARHVAVLPLVALLTADNVIDAEGQGGAWPAQTWGAAVPRPTLVTWLRRHVQAVLDALHSVRRSGITRISLPPPAGA